MNVNSVIRGLFISWALLVLAVSGCATTGTGAKVVSTIDSFYDKVVDSKAIPDLLKSATLILQQADVLADMAKKGKVSPQAEAQANLLASQAQNL
jgi:hypothetical protein